MWHSFCDQACRDLPINIPLGTPCFNVNCIWCNKTLLVEVKEREVVVVVVVVFYLFIASPTGKFVGYLHTHYTNSYGTLSQEQIITALWNTSLCSVVVGEIDQDELLCQIRVKSSNSVAPVPKETSHAVRHLCCNWNAQCGDKCFISHTFIPCWGIHDLQARYANKTRNICSEGYIQHLTIFKTLHSRFAPEMVDARLPTLFIKIKSFRHTSTPVTVTVHIAVVQSKVTVDTTMGYSWLTAYTNH